MGLLDVFQQIVAADDVDRLHEIVRKLSNEWRDWRFENNLAAHRARRASMMQARKVRYEILCRTIWKSRRTLKNAKTSPG